MPLQPDDVAIIKRESRWVIVCRFTGYEAVALRFRTKGAAEEWLATQ
jgi:hypothetical protein